MKWSIIHALSKKNLKETKIMQIKLLITIYIALIRNIKHFSYVPSGRVYFCFIIFNDVKNRSDGA